MTTKLTQPVQQSTRFVYCCQRVTSGGRHDNTVTPKEILFLVIALYTGPCRFLNISVELAGGPRAAEDLWSMNMYAKQASGGDAVVPTLNAGAVYSNGFHQQAGPPQPAGPPLFSGPSAFSAPSKFPGYEQPGFPTSLPLDAYPQAMNGYDKHLVPQMPPAQGARRPGLTSSQHSELEAARRRAQKAAEGKRANATAAARRAKRRAANMSRAAEREDSGEPSESQQASQDEDKPAGGPLKDDEKEAKRLKRLLRNRVSAQQARERKKSYVSSLEDRAKELESQISNYEQKVNKLEKENGMLRNVIKNIQPAGRSAQPSPEQ
ncbi:hypothetical protein WJX74_003911 [Apatococcus lobatus]|uniref:BZIP domain-containing protein n=1 Tax=Apatococcus lobatus TaxID=904363 RepID=A0AAW1QH66_9CHLO